MSELSPELLALLRSGQVKRLRIELEIDPDPLPPPEPVPLVKINIGPVRAKKHT